MPYSPLALHLRFPSSTRIGGRNWLRSQHDCWCAAESRRLHSSEQYLTAWQCVHQGPWSILMRQRAHTCEIVSSICQMSSRQSFKYLGGVPGKTLLMARARASMDGATTRQSTSCSLPDKSCVYRDMANLAIPPSSQTWLSSSSHEGCTWNCSNGADQAS